MNLKKAFLILAFAMVSIIALLYGIDPPWFARTFFGVADLLSAISGHGPGPHLLAHLMTD